ncbi:MAG: HD domain-containing protein [Bacilli bacterium]|nr:HD domain-containing protein [Bacilli bacterium]
MNIVEQVKEYVIKQIEDYKNTSTDNYDFWNEHIKYVYKESIDLANTYNADIEVVSLGALLHDIALINKVGERKDHHINGEKIAKEVLQSFNYDKTKTERVLKCVYNHRSSKNSESIEETCVADADILAHFDNLPMLFNSAFIRNNVSLNNIRDWMKIAFEKDYNDLSEKTKNNFKERYNLICEIILGKD